jgi:CheY-like chemotaxis protein
MPFTTTRLGEGLSLSDQYGRDILRGRRVLVVENEYLIAMDIEACLIDAGAEIVGPFVSAAEALANLDGGVIDAALLDIGLDADDSYPVADEMRRRGAPFIFMSGYGPNQLKPEYAGSPFISKPFESARLAEKVAAIISGR